MSSSPRRPRRAVRPSGTVGTDESVLRSAVPVPVPAPPPAVPARPDAPVATRGPGGEEDPWLTPRSADDSDRGWGREEPTGNDDRLRREKPPHW